MPWSAAARAAGPATTATTSPCSTSVARGASAPSPSTCAPGTRRPRASTGSTSGSGSSDPATPTPTRSPSGSRRGSTRPAATSRCSSRSSAARASTTRSGSISPTARARRRARLVRGTPRERAPTSTSTCSIDRIGLLGPDPRGLAVWGIASWGASEPIARETVVAGSPIRPVTASLLRRLRSGAAVGRLTISLGVDTLCWHMPLEAGLITVEDVLRDAASLGAPVVALNLHHTRARSVDAAPGAGRRSPATSGCGCSPRATSSGRRGSGTSRPVGVDRIRRVARASRRALGSPTLRLASGFYRAELADGPDLIEAERRYVTQVLLEASERRRGGGRSARAGEPLGLPRLASTRRSCTRSAPSTSGSSST